MSVNSRLKAIQIIGQRKAFYRQRIPESTCAKKETFNVDILVTSRNGDGKIMQSIRIMSRSPSRSPHDTGFESKKMIKNNILTIQGLNGSGILRATRDYSRK